MKYKKHNPNTLQRQIYSYLYIIDDILEEINHNEDKRRKVIDSEVVFIALLAPRSFYENHG